MKRKALVSLSAALPIATLAVGSALAQPPKAIASELATPAAAVRQVAERASYIIIIITGAQTASSGIKADTPAQAAKSLDS